MRVAKIIRNGSSQAVRLPKEFRFEGDEFVKRAGNAVILLPVSQPWGALEASLNG